MRSAKFMTDWLEIDLVARVWTVPAVQMKAACEHRVPLGDREVAILENVFPARRGWVPRLLPQSATSKVFEALGTVLAMAQERQPRRPQGATYRICRVHRPLVPAFNFYRNTFGYPTRHHPAQHESMVTSLPKLSAASFKPSTVVRYGKRVSARSCTVKLCLMVRTAA